MPEERGPVIEASSEGIELRKDGGALGVSQDSAKLVTVSVSTQGSASAHYVDQDTGQVTDHECVCAVRFSFSRLAGTVAATAQTVGRKIDFPADSPVTAVSSDWSETRETPRGGAYLLDVHAVLSLRNSSQRRIRGVTLAVLAQEVTPGGKGSVSVPSLDVAPGRSVSAAHRSAAALSVGAPVVRWWR